PAHAPDIVRGPGTTPEDEHDLPAPGRHGHRAAGEGLLPAMAPLASLALRPANDVEGVPPLHQRSAIDLEVGPGELIAVGRLRNDVGHHERGLRGLRRTGAVAVRTHVAAVEAIDLVVVVLRVYAFETPR